MLCLSLLLSHTLPISTQLELGAWSRGDEQKNLSSPPRDPLVCVGDRICLYLSSEVIFGDLRYPVPLRGVLLMYIKAIGSPAHPDSFFVVLPPKTTQETTFRWAAGPVESSGVGASPGRKPTAIYKSTAIPSIPFASCDSESSPTGW